MEKRVKLDPTKVLYDGKSFCVVMSETELLVRFQDLKRKIAEDFDNSGLNRNTQ
jgi:hypothetical protein